MSGKTSEEFDTETKYDLFRQDDNGGEFHVGRFDFKPDATAKMRELAKGGHKHYYEIRPVKNRNAENAEH